MHFSYLLAAAGVHVGQRSEHGRDGVLVLSHIISDAVEDPSHGGGEFTPPSMAFLTETARERGKGQVKWVTGGD